jgi:hypothetical protein
LQRRKLARFINKNNIAMKCSKSAEPI